MKTTDTPFTDAMCLDYKKYIGFVAHDGGQVIPAFFARELEREIKRLKEKRDELFTIGEAMLERGRREIEPSLIMAWTNASAQIHEEIPSMDKPFVPDSASA